MDGATKFAVVGSGAVGCYYGGKLAQSGRDVHFLMRSDLETVRKNGLQIRSPSGDFHLPRVQAAGTAGEIGPSDVVLIALKTTSNAALEKLLPPLLHDGTLLLTLQNGLGNEEWLAERFGAERVLGGLCFVCLNRVSHGVIEHYGHGTLSIGEFRGPPQRRTRAFAEAFCEAGIEAKVVENLLTERWRKLVWNIPFNGLGIAARANTAEVLADAGLRQLARALMREVIAAADRLGHSIPRDFIEAQFARTEPMGPYRSSSQIDFESGRAVEVEAVWGEPLRQATRAGCAVPRLETLYFLLKRLSALSSCAPSRMTSLLHEFNLASLPAFVREFRPEWGIVLGSGLGSFVEKLSVEHALPFAEIAALLPSQVAGHAGRFVFAKIAGQPAVIAQGRVHLYEGHDAQAVTAGVRFMAALGVKKLMLTNAAGSAHPDYAPGEWMMLSDHLNLTGSTPLRGGPNFFDMSEVYSERLRRVFAKTAGDQNIVLHEGVYAGLPGPQYETPAEVRMLRALGADAIGMSTVLEAIQARALGLELAGFSCLTNWAAGLGKSALSHAEVLETGLAGAEKFALLIAAALGTL